MPHHGSTSALLLLLGCLSQLGTAVTSEVDEGVTSDFDEVAGSSKNARLIVILLGTGPTTNLIEESFFGGTGVTTKKFSEAHDAQIVIVKRVQGKIYEWNDVNRIAGLVQKAKSNRPVFVLGYLQGGGIAACVASKIKAKGLGLWTAPGDFVARGCTSGVNVAAEYIATGDQFRSQALSVWEKAKTKIKHTKSLTSASGTHVTPMTSTLRSQFWTFLFHPPQADVMV